VWFEDEDMATVSAKMFQQLRREDASLSDGQLLARFVAARDEASFAALLRRHGPMVLGVCRRVLRHAHDAEDAFQATFLVLARKAHSVVRRESVGCWLYGVAYRTALDAGTRIARRHAREKQVQDMPHPVVAPAEQLDWRPLLDRELSRLPEHYRSAIVLCDLEGRSRREAARLLGVPEGTLSSRLATGRKMLARRLTDCGLALSAAAMTAVLGETTASAQVPAALAQTTAQAAALVASGQLAGVSAPAVALMKGVIEAMLVKKLRLTIGVVMVVAAMGAVGFACRPGAATAQQPSTSAKGHDGKPQSELEALRKENELLKFNLQVVLEKAHAQETELQKLRTHAAQGNITTVPYGVNLNYDLTSVNPALSRLSTTGVPYSVLLSDTLTNPVNSSTGNVTSIYTDAGLRNVVPSKNTVRPAKEATVTLTTEQIDAILKTLRDAPDKESQRKAVEELQKVLQKMQEQVK
jgi:RNA polymerase sigma factor (sigma-70 family)